MRQNSKRTIPSHARRNTKNTNNCKIFKFGSWSEKLWTPGHSFHSLPHRFHPTHRWEDVSRIPRSYHSHENCHIVVIVPSHHTGLQHTDVASSKQLKTGFAWKYIGKLVTKRADPTPTTLRCATVLLSGVECHAVGRRPCCMALKAPSTVFTRASRSCRRR